MQGNNWSSRFLKIHQGSVMGISFHPKDRYIFCSGASDGKVNIYSAKKCQFLQSYPVRTAGLARNINAVRFTCEGNKILVTNTARRLVVIDVERGDQELCYDNCAFNGRDRAALAADPVSPNMVVCSYVNGKGLTLFDLRMPIPLDFLYDVHDGTIHDIIFLQESWPWGHGERSMVTVGSDGLCKVSTLDGRRLHVIEGEQPLNSVAATPEVYNSSRDDGFTSLLTLGGSTVASYAPDTGLRETLTENKSAAILKLRYSTHGSILYTVCECGVLRRYRRWPDRHVYLNDALHHKSDIEDFDISPYDEYLVTASKDRTIGVVHLGGPNHGTSEYSELT
ncbi:hypothetical protein NP493_212g06000 [Ridgeia piscesae]|uniref:Uncharacterized protein n=1 Tax=Ridgeia piscesae TaxID=27915 RepID=A0AAD9UEA1_RIDPI|nr:hypothetical protein NP493_212g06000 [Ridgeia piscesae]